MDNGILFGYISTYSGLFPIAAGVLFGWKKPFRFIILFLIYGLLTDQVVGYLESGSLAFYIQNLYSIVDALFLLWFVLQNPVFLQYQKWFRPISIILIIFWFFAYDIWHPEHDEIPPLAAIFEISYEILLSSISAFALIKISEFRERSKTVGHIWFLSGIFLYNFTSFFPMAFMRSEFIKYIWIIPIISNVVSMILYTLGFLQLKPSKSK